jgi:hypothetical protein
LAVCEVHIAILEQSNFARHEIDLHYTVPEKVGTQNSINALLATLTDCPKVNCQNRRWQIRSAGYSLQIVHPITQGGPTYSFHRLLLSEF